MIEKITKGIVLRKWIFEDEHIVKILTEGGSVLSLKAKGLDSLLSKNAMSLHPFNTVEVEYFTSSSSDRNTGRLKRSTIITEFKGEHNHVNYEYIEVIRSIITGQEHNSNLTYETLREIIYGIENGMMNFQKLLALMILTMRQNGYQSIVDRCAKCGSNQNIMGFEVYEGGLICKNHEEAYRYKLPSKTLVKLIEINSLIDPIRCRDLDLTPEEITKIKSMYKIFFENQLAINMYMLDSAKEFYKG